MPRITKASFARAKSALGIKKVTKKNFGRIAKKASGGGSRSSKLTKTVKKTTRRRFSLARRRRGRRGSRKFTLPLAPLIGLAAGIAPAIGPLTRGQVDEAVKTLRWNYLGIAWDGAFAARGMMNGLFPLILGVLVHKFVGGAPLNVNRMLASAGVPIIRI